MEVSLSPDQQKAIEYLATQNGTSPADQVRQIIDDALRREADYDRWFREKVREGLTAAQHGDLIDHEEVGEMLKRRRTAG